jgi:hypothetical protein
MNRILAAVAAAALLSLPLAASAETERDIKCLEHNALANYLDRAFQEDRVAEGELSNGNRLQLFASRKGTWTMVELSHDGLGCIAGSGDGLRALNGPPPRRPAS